MPTLKPTQLRAVDFFCGAGGMSFGLSQSGIEVLAGIDNSADCRPTYLANIPSAVYIKRDVRRLTALELERRIGIAPDDPDLVFVGCSPCQFWSQMRTDKTKSTETAFLLKQFQRFVAHFRPGFVVVENVPGLVRTKQHTVLDNFKQFLFEAGYSYDDGIVMATQYGVPQTRTRYLLIASRHDRVPQLPPADPSLNPTVADFLGPDQGFTSIPAGHRDPTAMLHTTMGLSEKNRARIGMTPKSGGNRSAWSSDPDLRRSYQGDQFSDVYGRMAWDRPAPTITTKFLSLSNGRFGHPDQDRAISIREGAALQTFPPHYLFHGTTLESLSRQIGNAVPPELARRIGVQLISMHSHCQIPPLRTAVVQPVHETRANAHVQRKKQEIGLNALNRRLPQQKRSSDTAKKLLETAATIMETDGANAMTTNAVARAAGISVGALYRYFDNKEAIFVALLERETLNLVEQLARSAESNSGRSGLSRMVDIIVRNRFRRPALAIELDKCKDRLPRSGQLSLLETHLHRLVDDCLLTLSPDAASDGSQDTSEVLGIIDAVADAAIFKQYADIDRIVSRTVGAILGYLSDASSGQGIQDPPSRVLAFQRL